MSTYAVDYVADGQEIRIVFESDMPRSQFKVAMLLDLAELGVFQCDVTEL